MVYFADPYSVDELELLLPVAIVKCCKDLEATEPEGENSTAYLGLNGSVVT